MNAPWMLCTAMRVEAAALRRGLREVPAAARGTVHRTGVGAHRAQRAASLIAPGGAPVAAAGVGGGLTSQVQPGDVVVADRVMADPCSVDDGVPPAVGHPAAGMLATALRRRGLTVHVAPVVSTDRLVSGAERERLAATGAVVADLESAWLLSGAGPQGATACVRVVADPSPGSVFRPETLGHLHRAIGRLPAVASGLAEWAAATTVQRVLLAAPRSFCAGVDRAIAVVERALDRFGPPVYVRKQIVHNTHVVADLRARGAVFVDDVDEVPAGAVTVFSAHGVAPEVRRSAAGRELSVIDATCPLVTKVHAEARRFAGRGDTILLIGHPGHEETEGTLGEAPERITLVPDVAAAERVSVADPERVSYLVQTTLAVDEAAAVLEVLRRRFPKLAAPPSDDICYATTNRQQAVAAVAEGCDVVLVLGSGNSSNSQRLAEVAERSGTPAYLVDDAASVDLRWLAGVRSVGVTAGASAPPALVDEVVAALSGLGASEVREHTTTTEDVHFTLPKEVRSP